MNTSYVDMYFIHYVSNAKKELTPEVKAWAEKAKAEGKIRLFGFSAHKNMEKSMMTAAELGWVAGIMMSYNYRLMVKEDMKRAVDACVNAGIGLTAMKTQATFSANFYSSIGSETDEALKLTRKLMDKGYTAEQAKLKVVWENPHIASICSAMPNMTILQANVAAGSIRPAYPVATSNEWTNTLNLPPPATVPDVPTSANQQSIMTSPSAISCAWLCTTTATAIEKPHQGCSMPYPQILRKTS